jgi:hypothetical protein
MAFNSRHVELSKASSVVHILWKFFLSISTVHAAAAKDSNFVRQSLLDAGFC